MLPAALATVYVVWGSTYLAIRVMVETMPPLLAAGARFGMAGAIFWVILRLTRRGRSRVRR
jgi:drug/metabolite transporter (DMT)-like permease